MSGYNSTEQHSNDSSFSMRSSYRIAEHEASPASFHAIDRPEQSVLSMNSLAAARLARHPDGWRHVDPPAPSPQEQPPRRNGSLGSDEWSCSRCTLQSPLDHSFCPACGNPQTDQIELPPQQPSSTNEAVRVPPSTFSSRSGLASSEPPVDYDCPCVTCRAPPLITRSTTPRRAFVSDDRDWTARTGSGRISGDARSTRAAPSSQIVVRPGITYDRNHDCFFNSFGDEISYEDAVDWGYYSHEYCSSGQAYRGSTISHPSTRSDSRRSDRHVRIFSAPQEFRYNMVNDAEDGYEHDNRTPDRHLWSPESLSRVYPSGTPARLIPGLYQEPSPERPRRHLGSEDHYARRIDGGR